VILMQTSPAQSARACPRPRCDQRDVLHAHLNGMGLTLF
jgi:hypothetical protein